MSRFSPTFARGAHASSWLLTSAILIASLAAALQPGCLVQRDETASGSREERCATCHGDPQRTGDFLLRAAPPRDLQGAETPSYPGVGAHALHLSGSESHGPVACQECHRIPERTDSPGHADSSSPAELVFGTLASAGGRQPHYDFVARVCSNTSCHRDARAVWTEPRSTAEACGSCHGLPPLAPHPQSERCSACHGEVIDAEQHFVAPALHVNGRVETSADECTTCHGGIDGPAPPADTRGFMEISAIGVGAHRAHLEGGRSSRPLACAECHAVPDGSGIEMHVDGLPAEVMLSGIAETGGGTPAWNRVSMTCLESWCHGPSAVSTATSPIWTDPTPLGCESCHGAPPPAPHPQMTACSICHGDVVDEGGEISGRDRHVDGVVDQEVSEDCTLCHGDQNSAPPFALDGSTDTASRGVGAHQTHVLGTPRSRKVACGECHQVPAEVLAPAHIDSPRPAEVVFSGVALAYGASASYEAGSCRNSSCHGAVFPDGHASGGSNTEPVWTLVDGSQGACGSCHGLPPPAPHPYGNLNPTCNACHENIAADNLTFLRPELHVDGVVTFEVP